MVYTPGTWTAGVTELTAARMNNIDSNLDTYGGMGQNFRGVHLRSHYDSDKEANKVLLVNADEIQLHDRKTVESWSLLTADRTVSGAGGIDTGSVTASRCYEVHAIRKTSDGTKNLLLHLAPRYILDIDQSANDGDQTFNNSANDQQVAQGFQTVTSGKISFVEINLYAVGTVSGNLWVEIQSDNSGSPSGTVLATSNKINAVRVTTTGVQTVRFIFTSPYSATAGTQYHLVYRTDQANSGTNYFQVRKKATTNPLGSGTFKKYDGTTWSEIAVNTDAMFAVYVLSATSVTMPSGYDERALIGFCFTDGSSNLVPFLQMGNYCKLMGNAAQLIFEVPSGNAPTLKQIANLIPPGKVIVDLRGDTHPSGAMIVAAAGIPDGVWCWDSAVQAERFGGCRVVMPDSAVAGDTDFGVLPVGQIMTETQGIYMAEYNAAFNCSFYVTGFTWLGGLPS